MTGGGGHEALDLDLVFSVLENIVWGGQILRVCLPTSVLDFLDLYPLLFRLYTPDTANATWLDPVMKKT